MCVVIRECRNLSIKEKRHLSRVGPGGVSICAKQERQVDNQVLTHQVLEESYQKGRQVVIAVDEAQVSSVVSA